MIAINFGVELTSGNSRSFAPFVASLCESSHCPLGKRGHMVCGHPGTDQREELLLSISYFRLGCSRACQGMGSSSGEAVDDNYDPTGYKTWRTPVL